MCPPSIFNHYLSSFVYSNLSWLSRPGPFSSWAWDVLWHTVSYANWLRNWVYQPYPVYLPLGYCQPLLHITSGTSVTLGILGLIGLCSIVTWCYVLGLDSMFGKQGRR